VIEKGVNMKNTFSIFCILLLIQIASGFHYDDKIALTSFCKPALSDQQKQANLSFTDIYSFRLDESGAPTSIKPYQAKYTKIDDFKACVKDWKFSGFPQEALLHVELTWKHAVGWTRMRISSKDFSQITTSDTSSR
jgi:hypothetical protein